MCGALAIRLPSRVEQRAGKIQPLLDVDRIGRVLQLQPHLLGDVHEQVVEHFQQHRVHRACRRRTSRARATRRSSTMWSSVGELRFPAGLDHRGGVLLGDDGRPGDDVAGPQVLAHHQRGVVPLAARVHAHGLAARHLARRRAARGAARPARRPPPPPPPTPLPPSCPCPASGRRSAGGTRPRSRPRWSAGRRTARPAPNRCLRSAHGRAGASCTAPAAGLLPLQLRLRRGGQRIEPLAPPAAATPAPAAARSPVRGSRSGRPGPCRRPTARPPADARTRGSCPAHRPPGRHAGRRRRRSTAACSA